MAELELQSPNLSEPRKSDPTAQPESMISTGKLNHLKNKATLAAPSTASECESPRRTDHLWTKIDFKNPERARCYLERSGSAPIDVIVEHITEEELGPTPWVERTRSLYIAADVQNMTRIVARLCQNTPILQYMIICRPTGQWSVVLPPNLLKNAPLLRELEFQGVSPSTLSTLFLPKLTHFCWVNPWARTARVGVEDFLNLFESTPLVEYIEFEGPVQLLTDKPLKKLTLQNLSALVWTNCAGSNSLAPYIIAPKLTWLSMAITDRSQQRPTVPSSFLPPDCIHIPLLSEPTLLTYHCAQGEEECTLFYPTDSHRISIRYRSHKNSDDWFSHLVRSISFSKVQQLAIASNRGRTSALACFPIEKFENLEKLFLYGDVRRSFEMLGPSSGDPMPCTALSRLNIFANPKCWRSNLKTLLDVLRRRKKEGRGVKTLCIRGTDFSIRNTKALNELKGLVREAFFDWDGLDWHD